MTGRRAWPATPPPTPAACGRYRARRCCLLETTAGCGTALGSTFEELAMLRASIGDDVRHRIAFCADTCHLYSAGYDLVADYDGRLAAVGRDPGPGQAPLSPPERLQDKICIPARPARADRGGLPRSRSRSAAS